MKLTYLDTGVLIAAYKGDLEVFEAAFAIFNDSDRKFVISDFLKIELLAKPTFFKRSEEVNFYNYFFSTAIQIEETTPQKAIATLELACKYGLSAIDAFHLQTAIDCDVAEFVTTEKITKNYFRASNDVSFKITSIHQD